MKNVLVNSNPAGGVCSVKGAYLEALYDAGLAPLIVPACHREPERLFGVAGGVVLIGGADYPPEMYGMEEVAGMRLVEAERAEFDLRLARAALEAGLPVLGICGGCQIVNIACGGTLVRDIRAEVEDHVTHWKETEEPDIYHEVELAAGSVVGEWIGEKRIRVNSSHHQAVCREGAGVKVTARCVEDGVVEAIEVEREGRLAAVGVQWHPERIYRDEVSGRRLFEGFAGWVERGTAD